MQIESSRAEELRFAHGNAAASRERELLFYGGEEEEMVAVVESSYGGSTGEERGRRGGAGKREEVNQFESPGSDPAARERSVGQIAPYSLGYGPIRYSAKSPSRTCVRNGDSEISRAGFSGVSTGRMCTVSAEIGPSRNENAAVAAAAAVVADAREKRRDENIFSALLTKGKGGNWRRTRERR